MISFLPNLGLAAILLVGGREVIHGTLTRRRLHRLLRLSADADLADADARLHAQRRPARRPPRARGSSRSSTASRAIDRARRTRRRCPPGDGRVVARGVGLTFEGAGHPALRDVDLEVAAGADGRARRRDGLGQDRARLAAPPALRRQRRLGRDRRRRRPLGRPRQPAPRDRASSTTTRSCSRPRPRQHRLRAAGRLPRGGASARPARAQADEFIERAARRLRHAASASAA